MMYPKCHNCEGKGNTDGGFNKRINKAVQNLEREKESRSTQVMGKDASEIKKKREALHNEYSEKIKRQQAENPSKEKGRCLYCKGKGFRYSVYGIDEPSRP